VIIAALVATGVARAQEQTIEIKSGEVLAVSGNLLTVSTPEGVKQFNIPPDFTFNLEGRQVKVSELKPGTKLAALIRTTTTPVELTSTEIRHGTVVYTNGSTLVVKDEQGEMKKFTDQDLRNRGVIIEKDGQPVSAGSLKAGDEVSALVVTKYPPQVVTQQDVAVLAKSPAPPPPPPPARDASEPVLVHVPPPTPAMPKTASALPLVALIGAALLVVGLGMRLLSR